MTSTLLCALLALAPNPVSAGEPAPALEPSPDPAERLLEAFGPEGFDALRISGLAVVHGKKGAWRLQWLDWSGLGELAKRASAAAALETAALAEAPAEAGAPSFMPILELRAQGLITPRILAAAQALAAQRAEAEAAGPALEGQKDLFDTPCGRKFADRTLADQVWDPSYLAKQFFDRCLAGTEARPDAAEHFLDWAQARHKTDLMAALDADLKVSVLSDEVRSWLRKYLHEQRRLSSVVKLRKALRALGARGQLASDLRRLGSVTKVLLERPSLLADMETWAKSPSGGKARLKSVGLHLPDPVKLGQNEVGDAITPTGGYWLDGLADGAAVEVMETTALETDRGLELSETKSVSRRNGGPYPIARRLILPSRKKTVFRVFVSAADGASFADGVEVPVSGDYETAVHKLAVADQRAVSCDFKAAETAYSELEQSLADAAKEKTQYRDLALAAKTRRGFAAKHAEELARAEELAAAAREDGSPERCKYDAVRTESAIRAARALAPGCDRLLPELEKELALVRRRAADQKLFLKLVEDARSKRRSCAYASSAEQFAAALAVLDADPAARCGAVEAQAQEAEKELVAARADALWSPVFEGRLAKAEEAAASEERLAQLRPVLARIDTFPSRLCFDRIRGRIDQLAAKAENAIEAPETALADKLLPPDPAAAPTIQAVAAERRRLIAENEQLQARQAAEQAPLPATMPKDIRIQAEPGTRSRLDCLESGLTVDGAPVDCNGEPFKAAELKALREKFGVKAAAPAAEKSTASAKPAAAVKPAAKPKPKPKPKSKAKPARKR